RAEPRPSQRRIAGDPERLLFRSKQDHLPRIEARSIRTAGKRDEPFVDDVDGRAVRPRPGVDASERQLDGVDDLANGLRGPGAQVGCALTTLKQEQARDMMLHASVQPARSPPHAADTEA